MERNYCTLCDQSDELIQALLGFLPCRYVLAKLPHGSISFRILIQIIVTLKSAQPRQDYHVYVIS